MSFSNPLYMDYKSIISSNQEKIKNLRQKLSTYSDQIESGSNTILIEKEIEKDISSLKDSLNELENAYNYKNAPSQMSSNEIDRRQKEIKAEAAVLSTHTRNKAKSKKTGTISLSEITSSNLKSSTVELKPAPSGKVPTNEEKPKDKGINNQIVEKK